MRSIDDVIRRLDEIVSLCARERSRAGYFAALYRQMTVQVKAGMLAGRFDDAARMEHLDVVFAERYFEAFDAWRSGRRPTLAWETAFRASGSRWLAIVQQMLLGVNAHINLDLGIAAAQVCPGDAIYGLKHDFDEINRIISGLSGHIMTDIGEVSPWFALLDRVAGKADQAVVNFSIAVARREAWRVAEQAAPLNPEQLAGMIERRDREVAHFAGVVRQPGLWGSILTALVAFRESQDVPLVIAALSDRLEQVPYPTTLEEQKTAAASLS